MELIDILKQVQAGEISAETAAQVIEGASAGADTEAGGAAGTRMGANVEAGGAAGARANTVAGSSAVAEAGAAGAGGGGAFANSFEDVGCAKIDSGREARQGFPEVIFCEGKTDAQLRRIYLKQFELAGRVFGTRASAHQAAVVREVLPQAEYDEVSRILKVAGAAGGGGLTGATGGEAEKFPGQGLCKGASPTADKSAQSDGAGAGCGGAFATFNEGAGARGIGKVVVCCAGTSDIGVAEEAAQTAEFFGSSVVRLFDVGVAGIHRLLAGAGAFEGANCVIAVAGMEGALASVVGGLVRVPVIAVPTSVGYGASFGGLAALLTMVNSCANGIAVVNIDNGFGAGYVATQINRLAEGVR